MLFSQITDEPTRLTTLQRGGESAVMVRETLRYCLQSDNALDNNQLRLHPQNNRPLEVPTAHEDHAPESAVARDRLLAEDVRLRNKQFTWTPLL